MSFTLTSFPAGGDLASKSVAMLNPLLQQLLVKGPFVHAGSGTAEVVVACLSAMTGEASRGMMAAKAAEPRDSQQATCLSSIVTIGQEGSE